MVSSFDEDLPKNNITGSQYAADTALHKAMDVSRSLNHTDFDIIIGADTVVECDGHILEKPENADDARRMLNMLSGRSHSVHTGCAVIVPTSSPLSPSVVSFCSTTDVTFDALSPAAIDAYIETGEPFGKAGAYGIQGSAAAFVSSIRGCYFNVVGLPLHMLGKQIEALIESGAMHDDQSE